MELHGLLFMVSFERLRRPLVDQRAKRLSQPTAVTGTVPRNVRAVFDAYSLINLVQGNVGTEDQKRTRGAPQVAHHLDIPTTITSIPLAARRVSKGNAGDFDSVRRRILLTTSERATAGAHYDLSHILRL
ncbi:hypothetical protein DPEC_G00182430 [Dallia pectoralis]|uniref:Uncharacterized protein n=1 Tax=Dallia pectoralis TaxID=75939 RepID=A0ACC2GAM9_DALPE|nr:hypothetical protein DPEC_G00182430 [Dallia pectoralis]